MLFQSAALLFAARPLHSTQIHLTLSRSLSTPSATSYILRTPPRSAPREVPTPLVFLSARAWDEDSGEGMTALASMFAEKGFTCIETDFALPSSPSSPSSTSSALNADALMQHFDDEMKSVVRLSMIPFPPVIIARSAGALVAQRYISSNPASGLILISPPASNKAAAERGLFPGDAPLREFDFEPKFPIAIMATPREMKMLRSEHRLGQDPGVDKIVVQATDGQEAFTKMELWLDELGI
ncbi:hypothetical protein PLICRDRAFT_100150 [Plicaturopsis crispa FD-325 SS-3]|nr:hypothetical protein PLICRDRAFT_100150 [Plicaturopsis crispa FD-325 SS-3]